MTGVWLLPTRRRLPILQRFLDAAIEQGCSTKGWVLVFHREYHELKAEYDALRLPEGWSVMPTMTESMGDKFREIWPHISKMDWVGWVVDDVIPMTQKWDTTLISGLNGANLISCNDGARAPFRMHCPVISGDWLRALGYLYPPDLFYHTYWDDALERLGRATDSWWVCMDVLLKHEDQFQTGQWDETGVKSYSKSDKDKADLKTWRLRDMDGAVRRIMELKARQREPQRKVANA